MSDVLQDAEAILNKARHYPEDAYAALELLPELVAEIKRPREQILRLGRLAFFGKDEPIEKIIDHFIQWGDSTFKHLQELKGQLAAKDEEIKRLLFDVDLKTRQHANQSLYIGSLQGMLTDFNEIMEWQEEQLATKDEEIKRLRELGLQIEQEASYVKRLEEKISDFYECDATRRGCCRQVAQDQARAALVKIREGK